MEYNPNTTPLNPQKRASEWVDTYGDLLFRFAYQRTGSKEIAEDLVQDTLLSAFKSLDSFEERASDKTWLMRILRNKIIDHYRKTRTRQSEDDVSVKKEVSISSYFDESGGWNGEHMPHESWDDQPDGELENSQLKSALERCIDNLKGKGASAFRMKYIEDEESEEICKVLNITSSNYWVLIHRAKLQLRDCLDQSYFNELKKFEAQ
ncbi:MAG: sigma-70 family RNA polymerase sigma factor [Bacteroidetes bacterium]|nr:MAG: sigma-70 family RNA polymerase sigma factor [Bacteroidota bacterium]